MSQFNALKSFLTSRNDALNDNKQLTFEKMLEKLANLLEPRARSDSAAASSDVDESDEVEDQDKGDRKKNKDETPKDADV